MRIDVAPGLRRLAKTAADADMPMYIVGGAVRNPLLGLPVEDTDICGPRQPDQLAALCCPGVEVRDTVNGLGTAIVRCDGQKPMEYTAFRKDSYSGSGAHRPSRVLFTASMEEDALRRDFTVNALYADPLSGDVADPLGRGLSDLEEHVLRMTRPQTMAEDALRVLRMVRFAAELGFSVDSATFEAAREHVSGLAEISWERRCREFFRILLSDAAYGVEDGPRHGLFMLRDLGALAFLVPELEEGAGFAQNPRYHRHDVLDHQLMACAAAPADLTTRLAALLHDMAKPRALERDGVMYEHPKMGAELAEAALRRLRAPKRLARDVGALVLEHMFDLQGTARAPAIRRRILGLGQEQFQRLINLRIADFEGSGMGHHPAGVARWREVLDAMVSNGAPFTTADLAVCGSDLIRVLGVPAGPQVGRLLEKLLLYAAGKPAQNTYECLLRYATMACGTTRPAGRPGRQQRMVMEDPHV